MHLVHDFCYFDNLLIAQELSACMTPSLLLTNFQQTFHF